jgi:RNA polymerase sigma factor (TIGR02999 family)
MTAPAPAPQNSVTLLLRAMGHGDAEAGDELLRTVYTELRQLASAGLRNQPPGQTLQPTALVNEAYLRLLGQDHPDWEGRRHFFFAAARAMHDVLVESARKKAALKHGGAWKRSGEELLADVFEAPPDELLALDEALRNLERQSPDLARLVQLRFFVGLTEAEVADVMAISERTVQRKWRLVRAKLFSQLSGEEA